MSLRINSLANFITIGESILITDFYKVLQGVDGVVDVVDLEIVGRTGAGYAASSLDYKANLTADGRRILADSNSIFELKYPNVDIKGSVQ